jgi:hypothetical protein
MTKRKAIEIARSIYFDDNGEGRTTEDRIARIIVEDRKATLEAAAERANTYLLTTPPDEWDVYTLKATIRRDEED